MKRALTLILLLLCLVINSGQAELFEDLVINYSDFSYINAVTVGFEYAYFATTNGVIRYHITENRWAQPLTGINGLPPVSIRKIDVTFDDAKVCVGTELGMFEYSEVFRRWEQLYEWPQYDNQAKHLYPDVGYLPPWGFNYLYEGQLADEYGRIYRLTDIVNDSWTNLWIGSWGLGPLRADDRHYKMEMINYGLLQEDITTLLLDNDNLWMGGLALNPERSGVTRFDWQANSFEYMETFATLIGRAYNIYDIEANHSYIYIATESGCKVVDRKSLKIVDEIDRASGLPDDIVLSLALTDDFLYAGTAYGLAVVDLYADSLGGKVKTYMSEREIVSLFKFDDFLWIGTDRGGYRLNLNNNTLARLKAPEITQNGYIFDFAFDGRLIWLATEDELVSIDLETAEIGLFPEVNNYGGVRAVAASDTVVAVAVPAGLLLLFNGKKPHHTLFTVNDGLISDDIRDLVFDGDYLWLGTAKGLTRFWYTHPEIY